MGWVGARELTPEEMAKISERNRDQLGPHAHEQLAEALFDELREVSDASRGDVDPGTFVLAALARAAPGVASGLDFAMNYYRHEPEVLNVLVGALTLAGDYEYIRGNLADADPAIRRAQQSALWMLKGIEAAFPADQFEPNPGEALSQHEARFRIDHQRAGGADF